jgi:colanic acid biosynthesis glycosyl transferase WcaI
VIHSINYAPEVIGVGKYNREMAEWLANRGHEVRVVTAPP